MKTINSFRTQLRVLLSTIICTLLFISCSDNGINDSELTQEIDATIVINNVGASAWIIEEVNGDGVSTQIDVENAQITLIEGGRYQIVNLGAANHPFELRDAEGTALIAEAGNGSLQNYTPANVVVDRDEDTITFTLTGNLAENVSTYNCQPHPDMIGDILVD